TRKGLPPRAAAAGISRSLTANAASGLKRRLFFDIAVGVELADIGPKVVDLLLVLDAGEDHFGAGDFGPGIFYVVLEGRLAPDNAGILVGIGIAEIRHRAGFAAVNPVELGTDLVLRVGADGVAGHAYVEHGFALLGILRHAGCRRCDDQRGGDGRGGQVHHHVVPPRPLPHDCNLRHAGYLIKLRYDASASVLLGDNLPAMLAIGAPAAA